MSIVLVGSTSGSVTLQEPAVAGSTVLSLPATTGTVLTSASPASDLPSSINGPAFSAFNNALQAVATATQTKIQFNTEEFDTNSNYDNVTNYRFTPTVAGYYQVNLSIGNASGSATSTYTQATIYKNGSAFKANIFQVSANGPSSLVSAVIYMNGTTDYLEGYWFQNSGGSQSTASGSVYTVFSASMVRAA